MLLGNGKKKSIYDTITFVIMRLYILVATLSPVKKKQDGNQNGNSCEKQRHQILA